MADKKHDLPWLFELLIEKVAKQEDKEELLEHLEEFKKEYRS